MIWWGGMWGGRWIIKVRSNDGYAGECHFVTCPENQSFLPLVCSSIRGNSNASSHYNRDGRGARCFVCNVISLRVIGDRLLISDSTALRKMRQLPLDIAIRLP